MTAPTSTLTVRWTDLADPLVRPLLDELAYEYATRYQGILAVEQIRAEMEHYPAAEFAPPDGALVLLLEDGEPVAGGAFRRRHRARARGRRRRPRAEGRDEAGLPTVPTAELKRIWTHHAHRRRGLAARVVAELEQRASRPGLPAALPDHRVRGSRRPSACTCAPATRRCSTRPAEATSDRSRSRSGWRRPHEHLSRTSPASWHRRRSCRRAQRATRRRSPACASSPSRHPGRWLATAVVAVLLAMVVSSLVTNDRWQWSVVTQYLTWPSVLSGLWGTLRLTFAAAVIGFALGTVLALMRLSRSPLLRGVAWALHLGVPVGAADPAAAALVQPALPVPGDLVRHPVRAGVHRGATPARSDRQVRRRGARSRALQAAYSAEIVRAGILGVDQGQHEAAAALGIPRCRSQPRIVLPQAMRTIVPTAINEIIGLVKGTSVVYVLAYGELFYTVGVIYGRNPQVVPLLLVAAIWYLVITTVLTVVQYYMERHYAKGALRTLPPTPVQRLRWSVLAAAQQGDRRVRCPTSVPPSYAARSTLGAGHLFRTGGDR